MEEAVNLQKNKPCKETNNIPYYFCQSESCVVGLNYQEHYNFLEFECRRH